MIRTLIFGFLLLSSTLFAQPQIELTDSSKVSLVTCGPGEELYEAFGHTAIRVYDPSLGFDDVYNYVTFVINQPNVYCNFVQGRPLSMLA